MSAFAALGVGIALTGCNGGQDEADKKLTDTYKNQRTAAPPSGDQMKKSLDNGHSPLPPGAAGAPGREGVSAPPGGAAPPAAGGK